MTAYNDHIDLKDDYEAGHADLISECEVCGMPVRVTLVDGDVREVFAVCGHPKKPEAPPKVRKPKLRHGDHSRVAIDCLTADQSNWDESA